MRRNYINRSDMNGLRKYQEYSIMKKQNPGRKLKAHGPSGIHNKGEYTMPYTALSHCSLTCEPKDDWGTDLTSTAVRFLRDTCQDLRFSREKKLTFS